MSRLGALGALSGLGQGVQNLGQQMYKSALEERRMMLQEKLKQDAENRAYTRLQETEDRAQNRLEKNKTIDEGFKVAAENREKATWNEQQQVLFDNAVKKIEEQARVELGFHKNKANFDKENRDDMSMPLVYDDGTIRMVYQLNEKGKMTILEKGTSPSAKSKNSGGLGGGGTTAKDYNTAMKDYSAQMDTNFKQIKDELNIELNEWQPFKESIGSEVMMEFQQMGYIPNGENMAYAVQEAIRKNPEAVSRKAAEAQIRKDFAAKDDRLIKFGDNFSQEDLDKAVATYMNQGKQTIKDNVKMFFYNSLRASGELPEAPGQPAQESAPAFDPTTGTYVQDGSLGAAQQASQATGAPPNIEGSSLSQIMAKTRVQDGKPSFGEYLGNQFSQNVTQPLVEGAANVKEGFGAGIDTIKQLAGQELNRKLDDQTEGVQKGVKAVGRVAAFALDPVEAFMDTMSTVLDFAAGKPNIKLPKQVGDIKAKMEKGESPKKAELIAYSAWLKKNKELYNKLTDADKAMLDKLIQEAK